MAVSKDTIGSLSISELSPLAERSVQNMKARAQFCCLGGSCHRPLSSLAFSGGCFEDRGSIVRSGCGK